MMASEREGNPLRAAVVLAVLMLALFGLLAGCAPTPFKVGPVVATPPGCADARERGHEC